MKTGKVELAVEKDQAKTLRPWYKKKRFLIPIAFVVVIVIAAITGNSGNDDESNPSLVTDRPEGNVQSGSEERNQGDTLFPGRPDSKKGDIEVNVGEAAELSGYTVTVTKSNYQDKLSDFEDEGYLISNVSVLNRDDKAQPYNVFEWKLITPSGTIIDPAFTSAKQLGSGDLAKNGRVSGQIIWEVGNHKGDFYIVYDPSDFGNERAVWKVII